MAFYTAKKQGNKKAGSRRPWQHIKFDRQIVSIAKVNNATAVYSNDKEVLKWSEQLGMQGIAVWDLADPPPAQTLMNYPIEESEESDSDSAGANIADITNAEEEEA